jgi:hypothetical protein
MESSVFLCAKSSSAPGRHFLGFGEALPRLRGGNGSAPGSNRFGSGEEKKGLSDSISLSLREYLLIAK